MRQVTAVVEIPRDFAFSRLYERQYIYPDTAQYNFNLVTEMVLGIDATLVAAIKREVEE
jgi:hypothetical protein